MMPDQQSEDIKSAAGTLIIYGVFCLLMLGVYAWSVRRSHQMAEESYARLDDLARERAEPPPPAPRRARAKPEANGDNG
jgi:hypothetical protein